MVKELFVRHVLLQVAVSPILKPGSGLPRLLQVGTVDYQIWHHQAATVHETCAPPTHTRTHVRTHFKLTPTQAVLLIKIRSTKTCAVQIPELLHNQVHAELEGVALQHCSTAKREGGVAGEK